MNFTSKQMTHYYLFYSSVRGRGGDESPCISFSSHSSSGHINYTLREFVKRPGKEKFLFKFKFRMELDPETGETRPIIEPENKPDDINPNISLDKKDRK